MMAKTGLWMYMTWDVISTPRGSTLTGPVVIVLRRILAVCALPLVIQGKLHIMRRVFTHAGSHGVETSLVSQSSLTKLRSAFVAAVWYRKVPLANSKCNFESA